MNRKEVAQVAKLSAVQTVNSLRGELGDMVRSALPIILAETGQESSPAPLYRRAFVEPPVKQPGNYGQATMESARWRSKRGPCLAQARLCKRGDGVLVIEQYGNQCSMLHRSEMFERSKFEGGKLVKSGNAPWDKFYAAEGDLTSVVAQMLNKGWSLVQDQTPNKQLELLPGASAQPKEGT